MNHVPAVNPPSHGAPVYNDNLPNISLPLLLYGMKSGPWLLLPLLRESLFASILLTSGILNPLIITNYIKQLVLFVRRRQSFINLYTKMI